MSIILGLQVQPQNLLLTYPYSRLYACLDLNILPRSRLQSAFKTVALHYLKGGGLTAKFHLLIVRHSLSDFCLNWFVQIFCADESFARGGEGLVERGDSLMMD
jgi:hypothetical protein